MVMVSNFQPRRSGIIINNYFNCEGDVMDSSDNPLKTAYKCSLQI